MKTWRERIAEGRERGRFTPEDVQASNDWETCAVGEQHQNAPRFVVYKMNRRGDWIPRDFTLAWLGGYSYNWIHKGFAGAVREGDFDAAERLLNRIEDRALKLKREASC